MRCPLCRQQIFQVSQIVDQKNKETNTEPLKVAYSFIYTSDFKYEVGKEIFIPNYNGDLSVTCAPGVHFHMKPDDVFKWFEYLEVPDEIKNIRQVMPDFKFHPNTISNEKTNERTNEKTNEKTNERINEKTNESTNEKTNEVLKIQVKNNDPLKDALKDEFKDEVKKSSNGSFSSSLYDPLKEALKGALKDEFKDPLKEVLKDPLKDFLIDAKGQVINIKDDKQPKFVTIDIKDDTKGSLDATANQIDLTFKSENEREVADALERTANILKGKMKEIHTDIVSIRKRPHTINIHE